MSRPTILLSILLGFGVACGGDGGGSPPAPTPTTTSVSVAFPTGGPIFIGNTVQFEARETLSNGTTRVATNATWGSDAPTVATVSSTGLVTAVAAGQATIFADVNPRGTLLIRVFPNFGGTWAGSEVVTSCQDSGGFEGFCDDPASPVGVGDVFAHNSRFTQTEASVAAVIDLGGGESATMTGTITIGGELQLPAAPVLPPDPLINVQVQNWRSRADSPSRMTGTYEGFFTAPGVTGSLTIVLELRDVVKRSTTTALSTTGGSSVKQALRRISDHLKRLR